MTESYPAARSASTSNGRPGWDLTGHVTAEQRFRGDRRCPICDGSESDPRGQSRRCTGFLSSDGEWCHCSREEHAGRSALNPGCQAYPHLLKGACPCGIEHAPADPKPAKKKRGKLVRSYPYLDENGQLLFEAVRFKDPKGFSQRRPDPASPGKWLWNLKGVRLIPYRLPELVAVPPGGQVLIVEGEKDVDRLRSLGFTATCNPMGAEKWRAEYSEHLRGRHVAILPDNDNDQVGRKHARQVATSLHGIAAEVRIVELPGLPEKGDVSDFLDAGGTVDDLGRLISDAPLWTPREAPTGQAEANGDGTGIGQVIAVVPPPAGPNEAPDDPHRLARVFRDMRCIHAEVLTLRWYQGGWTRWNNAYTTLLEKEVRAELTDAIKVEFDQINKIENERWLSLGKSDANGKECLAPFVRKVTTGLVNNVVQALTGLTLLASSTRQPAWLDSDPPFPANEILPCRNALVHLPSLVDGLPAIHTPTPLFFCPYTLDYDFDASAPEPIHWLTFLGSRKVKAGGLVKLQVWPDDPDSIGTLQEWFGYLLTPDTTQEKILALIGPRRSGKGTIARVMKAMIGATNVANPTLSSLGTNFGLAPLIGKPAAIITDARLSRLTDIAQTVERLLTVSGEDGVEIDRKHMTTWNGTLSTRFTMISNDIPRLADTSGALTGRMIILKLVESFFGLEDPTLTALLMSELPGILRWAIEGYRRLRERGHFVQPESGAPLIREMEDLSSPAGMFVRECCAVGPLLLVPVADLFTRWKDWCVSKNREHPGDESSFGRNLRAVVPLLETKPVRRNGKWERDFLGIDLEKTAEF